MKKVTLETILAEMKKMEIRTNVRFDQVDEQLKQVNVQLEELRTDLKVVRNQTARLTENDFALDKRVTKLEKASPRGNA